MAEENEKSEDPKEAANEEVNEMAQPPVVDLEVLLKPISGETPSGESVRYSGVYDEINEARREDDPLALGDTGGSLKTADFKKVIDLSVATLAKESKDLQVAAWLAEALVKEFGYVGLRDGLKLLSSLQEDFWETLFPEIDEGNMEGRANAIAWLDREAAYAIKYAPITSEGFGFAGLEDSKRFDIPENIDTLGPEAKAKAVALKTQAEKEDRTTTAEWNKAVAQTRRAFYEELDVSIEECKAMIKELDRVIEEKFDRNQAPGLSDLKSQLEEIQRETNKLLELKRAEEPDPIDEEEVSEVADGAPSGKVAGGSASGAIQSRRDALKKLGALSEFFKRTEPHSPVSYLVDRAVKWGNMPLETWLKDVIKDQNILEQLRQTLGFNTMGTEANPTGSPISPPPISAPAPPQGSVTPPGDGGIPPSE